MTRDQARTTLLLVGLGFAAGIAYVGTRAAGPVQVTQYTEQRQGPLQEHLVSAEELGDIPAAPRMHYPPQVAPGLTALIANGYAPLWRPPDPQIAALPSEAAW